MKFISRSNKLKLQLTPTVTTITNGAEKTTFGKVAEFVNGVFSTDDLAVADLVKSTRAFKDGDIIVADDFTAAKTAEKATKRNYKSTM